ncbi:hypothetical protein [Acidaminococcus intestini]|uniref:hypothetical protein n=1 Tax=Acidaminococcus intestini TaxID=187327 RepID=UPI00399510A3
MENTEQVRDQILEKKLNDYSSYMSDFKAEGELVVTITLNEYRSLVEEKANGRNYSSDNYELRKQVKNLQNEVSARDKRIVVLTEQLKSAARLVKAFRMMDKEDKK